MAVVDVFPAGSAPIAGLRSGGDRRRKVRGPRHRVIEGFSGYVIRRGDAAPRIIAVAQFVAWGAGIALLLAAWLALTAPAAPGAGGIILRGAAVLLAGAALLLFDFARRGTIPDLEVDLLRGELREVARHRAGPRRVTACHGFDSVSAVFVDQPHGRGRAALVVRLGSARQVLPVACGDAGQLEPLCDRLARDLLIRAQADVTLPPVTAARIAA
ncbi:MAG: hypothetical protein IT542_08035 [Rubellimicrobium sp.]|nr:hypothetical protein [Rubellimicrobium sp.]